MIESRSCATPSCIHKATMIPKMIFPAKGWKLAEHTPIAMMMDLPICGTCFKELKVDDWIGPELDSQPQNIRKAVEILTKGKNPVDFTRCFFEGVPLASKEYRAFKDVQDKGDPRKGGVAND